MTEQRSFPGLEPPVRPAEALFLCAMPDPSTGREIHRLGQRLAAPNRLTGSLVDPERLHVSILALGLNTPLRAVEQACGRVRFRAFDLYLSKMGSFTNTRPTKPFVLWVDAGRDELLALQTALYGELSRDVRPIPELKRLVTPHLTLLYDRRMVPEYPVQPVGWRVREFVLVRSFVGQSRYEILGRWPLEGE